MIEALLLGTGLLLVAAIAVDVLHTTIHIAGSGFFSRRLNHFLWRILRRWRPSLVLAGPAIMIMTVLAWFVLFWLGWCFAFASDTWSVVTGITGRPADNFSLIYYVGFCIITLGVGDYVPGGPFWQLLTVLAAASGFFIVTLVITYLLPLVSAVVEQRQLAAYIHSLGSSSRAVLELVWNGEDYRALGAHLASLTPMMHRQTYLHLAYPVLHYFRSSHRKSAIAPAVAVLDDTLTLLLHAVPEEQRPPLCEIQPLRNAIADLLQTLSAARIIFAADEPPIADNLAGELPQSVQERRRLLAGWLRDQRWNWRQDEESARLG